MKVKTPIVKIGSTKIGGGNVIAIQSMTNTNTEDAKKTAAQCIELANAGAELVRITVNTEKAAKAVPQIRKILNEKCCSHIPLIGDFHFNGHDLLEKYPECAKALDKYRINPGNVGFGKNHDDNFAKIIKIAIKNKKPVRIGVNSGSVDQEVLAKLMNKNAKLESPGTYNSSISPESPNTAEFPNSPEDVLIDAMVKSALDSAKYAEKLGLKQNQIILSVKMSDVQQTIKAHELLTKRMTAHPYAIHLGLTEAGTGDKGVIASAAALSILLQKGIGNTIRISLTPEPGQSRTKEVEACKHLLQSLGLRYFAPVVTSCPGCGRTSSTEFQKLARKINAHIQKKLPTWLKKHPECCKTKIAVMGCVVNGPGESRHADIGISLPGNGEKPVCPVYIRGKFYKNLKGSHIAEDFLKILEGFIATL